MLNLNFLEYYSDILSNIEKYLNIRSFKYYIILLNIAGFSNVNDIILNFYSEEYFCHT